MPKDLPANVNESDLERMTKQMENGDACPLSKLLEEVHAFEDRVSIVQEVENLNRKHLEQNPQTNRLDLVESHSRQSPEVGFVFYMHPPTPYLTDLTGVRLETEYLMGESVNAFAHKQVRWAGKLDKTSGKVQDCPSKPNAKKG